MKKYTISKYIVISKIVYKVITFGGVLLIVLFGTVFSAYAGPQSTTYEIKSYDFGSGGIATDSSSSYSLFGNTGQTDGSSINSTNYSALPGLSYTIMSNTPGAPTVSNNSNIYYNKLSVTLNTSNNPSDTVYAIQVVSSGTQYVQADDTLGANPVWQTNTTWGASGFTIIGLTPGTAYTVSAAARQGNFTQSGFGPGTTVSTANPTFSYSLGSNSVTFPQLVPGSVQTSTTTVTVSMSTNGVAGGTVYAYDSNNGLLSSSTSYTIAAASTNLASALEGYGLRATAVAQTSGGPMEKITPYDGIGNNVGTLDSNKRAIFDSTGSSVVSGTGTFELQAKAGATAKAAGDYGDLITIIAAAAF